MPKLKPNIKESPMLELKQLSKKLSYVFFGPNTTFPVILESGLDNKKRDKLVEVLKEHKEPFAWKNSNIKRINPSFCTDKILMEEERKVMVHLKDQRI